MTTAAPSLVALLLWVGSTVLFLLFVRGIHLRIEMRRWPRHRGVVREQKVRSHRNLHGAGHHRPIVAVEYSAGGRRHLLRCDSPTRMGFANQDAARSAMARYEVGASVEIYVDPGNPRRAFLSPPETPALVMLLLGSLFLFAVGVGIV